MRSLALVLCIALAGCGDSNSEPDGGSAACGKIGTSCGAGCPTDLDCINGACVPVRGDCGGFAGAECQDTALTCAYPQGSSGGICMRPDEKACVCEIAPNALGDCVPP